jgi:hypothetical protein
MTDHLETISEFWRLFQEHEAELASISTAEHPVYDLILEQLQRIDPGLYFEFATNTPTNELIISAEGKQSLFPVVECVVRNAPDIEGWLVFALKPKLGLPVSATWEDFSVRIADVVFEPLERPGSDDLGLRMLVVGLRPEDVDKAHSALLRALDHGLGERAFAESVQFTEVVPLPQGTSPRDHIPLTDLEKFIEWRNRKLKNRSKN